MLGEGNLVGSVGQEGGVGGAGGDWNVKYAGAVGSWSLDSRMYRGIRVSSPDGGHPLEDGNVRTPFRSRAGAATIGTLAIWPFLTFTVMFITMYIILSILPSSEESKDVRTQ